MRALDMKTPASSGLVYITVNPAEEDVCRIGIAVSDAEQARVRQLSKPWRVFAERSVSDASAVETELCRRLDCYRNTARASRREFLVPSDEAEDLLDLVAHEFPLEARDDDSDDAIVVEPRDDEDALVAVTRVERASDIPDERGSEQEWEGADGRPFQPHQAAVIYSPVRWIGAALALSFVLARAMVGPPVIPFGVAVLVLFWWSEIRRQPNRALQGWGIDVRATVSAGPEGLSINGRLRAPSSALRAGFVVPDESRGPSVLLERKLWWPTMIRMGSVRDARKLLRTLGLDASQKTVTLRALCGTLTIGIDGISCSGSVNKDFFLSFAEVQEVSMYHTTGMSLSGGGGGPESGGVVSIRVPDEWGVDIALHDGRSVRVPLTNTRSSSLHEIVEERIRECVELSRGRHVPDDATSALRRRGRPIKAWLQALRAIGAGANADHRTAPMPEETLWEIVESASSTPDDRIAAAISLGASGAELNRDRLRIAAETTSAPRVRVALAAAADRDEEALIESLSIAASVAQRREEE